MIKRLTLVVLCLSLLSACGGEVEDTRPGQPVAHRRAAFKAILRSFEPIGVMMRTDNFDPEQFARRAGEVKKLRDAPWQYFLPDTNYPPTKAKPEVWADVARFEADRDTFLKATDHLAEVAGTADKEVAKAAFEAVQNACSDCHKAFKYR